MTKLIVIGGGGFSKEVIWLARDCGFDVVGILDDSNEMQDASFCNVPVIGKISDWINYSKYQFIIAIGSPRARQKICIRMGQERDIKPRFTTLIHPSVLFSKYINISEGTIICAGTILTADISIGRHCILNLSVTVGHDVIINDFVTIAPQVAVSGGVTFGLGVEAGTGSCIRQGLELESGAVLGMGGVLTKNIPRNCIYVGNPAKKLKEMELGLL